MKKTTARVVAGAVAAALAGTVVLAGTPAQAASTGYYYSGDDTVQIVENFVSAAAVGRVACGIDDLTKKAKKYRGRPGLPGIAALSSDISARTAGTNEMCKLGKQMLLAAAATAATDLATGQVYIEDASTKDECGYISQKYTYTYYIGPSPSETLKFSGSVKVPCGL
ncbi:hypothetical protein [Paractinoplanes maris]|uniref:hypothetical protein n=1 Tax=Paractinoplanes maris TaxID=1734446 RepID=UPI0020214CA9|nr:hypothetical protein [Actinoplanes maris]